ncbi:MAG: ComEC/Rec2 family competence protein [Patescibacteria group bacterium]
MRDKIFYAICFGFVFGVFFRSFFFVNFYITILFCITALAAILFFSFVSKNKWGLISGFFVLAILFGILRFHSVDVNIPTFFELQVGQKVEFLGIIIDEPEIKENSQKLIIETEKENEKVKILLSADFTEEYKYGDEVKFSGKLEKPENFITDYGKEFDYINYLKKDGIFYIMNFPELQIISHGNGNKIKNNLFFIKEKFLEKINFLIKEPESLLMGGLILGEKVSFDQALRQSFINTGTIHIVALSGYNITIVAEWIMKLFSFLPKNFGIAAGIGTIILFILMTGCSTTAVRAGIMATLVLIARATGRNYDVARALILAGVFMVFFNPLILAYDVSFQLSFIATIAVIFIAPKIEKYFTWITKKFGLRDIISVTCAAYIFVMPFILYKMGTFSVVALPANILILPFIPFTMALGFFTGLIGLISSVLALPFGIISYIFLHYELFVIGLFSQLPFSSFSIPNFPLIFTILIYLYFIYRIFGRNIKNFFIEPQ